MKNVELNRILRAKRTVSLESIFSLVPPQSIKNLLWDFTRGLDTDCWTKSTKQELIILVSASDPAFCSGCIFNLSDTYLTLSFHTVNTDDVIGSSVQYWWCMWFLMCGYEVELLTGLVFDFYYLKSMELLSSERRAAVCAHLWLCMGTMCSTGHGVSGSWGEIIFISGWSQSYAWMSPVLFCVTTASAYFGNHTNPQQCIHVLGSYYMSTWYFSLFPVLFILVWMIWFSWPR